MDSRMQNQGIELNEMMNNKPIQSSNQNVKVKMFVKPKSPAIKVTIEKKIDDLPPRKKKSMNIEITSVVKKNPLVETIDPAGAAERFEALKQGKSYTSFNELYYLGFFSNSLTPSLRKSLKMLNHNSDNSPISRTDSIIDVKRVSL